MRHTCTPLFFVLYFCMLLLDREGFSFLRVLSLLPLLCTLLHLLQIHLLLVLLVLLLGVALAGEGDEEPLHYHQPLVESSEGEGGMGCLVSKLLLLLDKHLKGFMQLIMGRLLQSTPALHVSIRDKQDNLKDIQSSQSVTEANICSRQTRPASAERTYTCHSCKQMTSF